MCDSDDEVGEGLQCRVCGISKIMLTKYTANIVYAAEVVLRDILSNLELTRKRSPHKSVANE